MRVSLLPATFHSQDFWVVCGYDSDLSLASYLDVSALFVRFEEEQSWGSLAVWGQWLSSEQGSRLRHLCGAMGQSCCLGEMYRWDVGV